MDTTPSAKRLLFVGMPETGKTSFLAALQHYVDADIHPKLWRQYKYASDTEYLNRIHTKWLNCERQARTILEQNAPSQVELFLENMETSQKLVLNVPDVEGELFSQQWELRNWTERYQNLVTSASGILLFILPSKIIMPVLLSGTGSLAGEFLATDDTEEDVTDWSHEKATTQVVLVDLVEFHRDFMTDVPLPISVILSAWDAVLVEDPSITPQDWLKINLPLFHQYLIANQNALKVKVFGVSAQGGDFEQEDDRTQLRSMIEPTDRIVVQVDRESSHDISAPVQWILDIWKEAQN